MNVFIDEVCTQAEALSRCLDHYFLEDDAVLGKIKDLFKRNKFDRILFAGMGSSFYAPYCVSGFLTRNGIPSFVFNAYDLARNYFEMVTPNTLLVCISQSGKSWEVVELAKKAKDRTNVIGIFNNENSPLSEWVDYGLKIYAGEERNISNKTYLCTQAVLNIFAHSLLDKIDDDFILEFRKVNDWIAEWLNNYQKNTEPLHKLTKNCSVYDFFADGESLSTVNQAALIFREGPKVFTGANQSSDYAHGWYWSAKSGYIAIVFSPSYVDGLIDKRMVERTLEKDGRVILFSQDVVEERDGLKTILLPNVRRTLLPLIEIIPCDTLMGLMLGPGWSR